MTQKEWALSLSLVPGVGGKLYLKLTETLGSPQNILQASKEELESVPGVGPRIAQAILSPELRGKTYRVLEILGKRGIQYVVLWEEGYPPALRELSSPPPVLFFKGDLQPLKAPSITVVGTRNASRYGMDMAFNLAQDLSQAGFTIISGLARGIDTAAHRGALQTGKTVAFVGSGLDRIYPPENIPLAREIVEKGGAVISPFPPETPPEKGNFPRRNLLMASLASGVLVVEAGEKSGAVMTARLAQNLGKTLFALPGPAGSPRTKGVHSLIKQGAFLIEEAGDILEILRPGASSKKETKIKKPIAMDEREGKVWEALEEGPLPVDIIVEKCNLSLQEAYTLLLEMELKGLVTSRGGNTYERRIT